MHFIFFITKRFLLKRNKKDLISVVTLIAVMGVILAVMIPIIVISVMNGFQEQMKSKILGVSGHINLFSYENEAIKNIGDFKQKLTKYEGVESVNPYIEVQGLLQKDKQVSPILLRGIEPNIFSNDYTFNKNIKIVEGEKSLPYNNLVLVGKELATRNFIQVGDRIEVVVSKKKNKIETQVLRLKVGGIFKTGYYQYDDTYLYTSLSTLQDNLDLEGQATAVDLKVKNIWNLSIVEKMTQDNPNYFILTWKRMNQNLFKALATEKAIMRIIMMFILVVAVFNIMSTQIMLVIEKRKPIAILKALGFAEKSIMGIFFFSSFIVNLCGSLIGSIFGIVIAKNIDFFIEAIEFFVNIFFRAFYFFTNFFSEEQQIFSPFYLFPKDVYYLEEISGVLDISGILLILGLSFTLSILSGILPAMKAAKLKPVEIFRYE